MTDPIDALSACGKEPPYFDSRGIVTLRHINWDGCMTSYKINHLNDPTTKVPIQDWVPTFPAQPPVQTVVENTTSFTFPLIVLTFFIVIIVAALVIILVNQNKINRSDQEELNTDA